MRLISQTSLCSLSHHFCVTKWFECPAGQVVTGSTIDTSTGTRVVTCTIESNYYRDWLTSSFSLSSLVLALGSIYYAANRNDRPANAQAGARLGPGIELKLNWVGENKTTDYGPWNLARVQVNSKRQNQNHVYAAVFEQLFNGEARGDRNLQESDSQRIMEIALNDFEGGMKAGACYCQYSNFPTTFLTVITEKIDDDSPTSITCPACDVTTS